MFWKENRFQRYIITLLFFIGLAFLIVACDPEPEEIPVTVEVTRLVEVPATVEVTKVVEVPVTVEVTRVVEVPPTVEVIEPPKYDCPVLADFVNTSGLTQNGYVVNQIIVTGNPEAVGPISAALNERFAEEFGLSSPVIGTQLAAVPWFDPFNPADEIGEIGLYELTEDIVLAWGDNGFTEELVWVVVNRFNEIAQDDSIVDPGLQFDVYPLAEPNYVVVNPDGISGDPGSSGIEGDSGSPGIAGDPGSSGIEGDPVEPEILAAAGNGAELFTAQWAFTNINLLDSNRQRQVSELGNDVKIIIFDSSPYPTGSHRIDWAATPFDLCVTALLADAAGSGAVVNSTPASSHGLFVAGLAQAVAPASQIHLIQVLDDNLDGSLFTLINALYLYTDGDVKLEMEAGGQIPSKTVINFSLGFEFDPTAAPPGSEAQMAVETLQIFLTENSEFSQEQIGAADTIPVVSLPTVLARNKNQGNVIVAAAGNDSGSIQAPASYDFVIGVASNNNERQHSCFSNTGNVAAPGGDTNREDDEEGLVCTIDLTAECSGEPNCDKAVISLIHPDYADSGYAYWFGTSFSTPIVSGLAALVLETISSSIPAEAIPTTVQNAIYIGTCTGLSRNPATANPMGAGIINVPTTLGSC